MDIPRSADGSRTLDKHYYLSPEIYQRESDQIFDRQWLCVGREEQIAEAGAYLQVEVEGESLILVRDEHKSVRCFYNVCRHRGARLCEQDQGTLGRAISCPYHAWTYDLGGRLIATPNVADDEDLDKSEYPLHSLPVATWEGFVFVNFSGQPTPFDQAYGPLLDKFKPWTIADLVSGGRLEYDVKANWKLIVQNYSECYHCPRVHPRLNALSAYRTAANDLVSGPFLGGPMALADGVDSMSSDGRACGTILPGLASADRRLVYYYTLFPGMFLSPHPDYVLVHRLYRNGVDATRVVCDLLFSAEAVSQANFDPGPAVEFWDQTNRQDWHVCELSQQGIRSRSYEPAPYVGLESTVAAFDRHYLEVMASG